MFDEQEGPDDSEKLNQNCSISKFKYCSLNMFCNIHISISLRCFKSLVKSHYMIASVNMFSISEKPQRKIFLFTVAILLEGYVRTNSSKLFRI